MRYFYTNLFEKETKERERGAKRRRSPRGEKFERARGEKENDGCANAHVRCQNRSDLAKTQ